MIRATGPQNLNAVLCDVRTVRNVRNPGAPRPATFNARAARLIAEARADQSSANAHEHGLRTSRTVRTSHDLLDAFFERAAVLEFDEDLSRNDAERLAALALGAKSADALFAAIVADWRRSIDGAEADGVMRQWALDARRLVDSGVVVDALRQGWEALSLWAARRTSTGASPAPLGLGPRLRGRSVITIDRHAAALSDGSLMLKPHVDARNGAAVFWENEVNPNG